MFEQASWHPILVHAPLVLIPVSVVFALIDFVRPSAGLRLAAVLLLAGGVGGAMLATQSGEAAQHQAERAAPAVEKVQAGGPVARIVGGDSLLDTHARLGEMTRNLYGLLLVADVGLLLVTTPALARFRKGRTLVPRAARLGRGAWLLAAVAGLVLVVFTGHYGGSLVYDHGVGVQQGTSSVRGP
jgi:uncharacterized membrane protein